MNETELKKLIEDCCNDIFDRLEPLANVKSRLYQTLKPAINDTHCCKSDSEQLPNSHYRREVDETIRYAGTPSDDEFDEDHALDMVMNDMVKDLTEDTEESHSDHLYEEPNLSRIKKSAGEWDEDHALDLVMNDMVKDLTEEDLK